MKSRCERQHVEPHGCSELGIHPVHCPICEGHVREDKITGERIADVTISYPHYPGDTPSNPSVIEVDLMAVRSTDSIRISYDFDRDGWVIKQASTFEWDSGDTVCDEDWQEVAFIRAWARQRYTGLDDPDLGELVTTNYGVGRIIGFNGFHEINQYNYTRGNKIIVRIDAGSETIDYEFSVEDLSPGPVGHRG